MSRGAPRRPPVALANAPHVPPSPPVDRVPELLVMDWGIGGLGVVRELLRQRPRAALTYFSDSGFLPYGKVPAPQLARRLERVLESFYERGVRRVVIACNAASTVVPRLRLSGASRGLLVHDVIGPGVALVRAARVRSVGLIGGARTVRSGAHRIALAKSHIAVVSRVAQPLSAFVEAGDLSSDRVLHEVTRVVAPLAHLPAILLACTHYPALLPIFRRVLPRMRFLDPATQAVEELLTAGEPVVSSEARLTVLTTGDRDAMRATARQAFGLEVSPLECALSLRLH